MQRQRSRAYPRTIPRAQRLSSPWRWQRQFLVSRPSFDHGPGLQNFYIDLVWSDGRLLQEVLQRFGDNAGAGARVTDYGKEEFIRGFLKDELLGTRVF